MSSLACESMYVPHTSGAGIGSPNSRTRICGGGFFTFSVGSPSMTSGIHLEMSAQAVAVIATSAMTERSSRWTFIGF